MSLRDNFLLLELLDPRNEFGDTRLPFGGVFFECFHADSLKQRRNLATRVLLTWQYRLVMNHHVKCFVNIFAHDGHIETKYFIEYDARRVSVGALVDIIPADDLFMRHIQGSARTLASCG